MIPILFERDTRNIENNITNAKIDTNGLAKVALEFARRGGSRSRPAFGRRYADAPAAALFKTGLATREWSPLALRPYASFFSLEELWGSAPSRARRARVDPSGLSPVFPRLSSPS